MSANHLKELIEAASRVVIFTGAGISTESDIPDFRSPGGVWDKFKPVYFQDFMDFMKDFSLIFNNFEKAKTKLIFSSFKAEDK